MIFNSSTDTKLWRSLKCVPFTLFNYSSLSYIVLAWSSAVTNLSNKTLIFHDFQGPTIKSHDFPSLEMKFINSMTFQVFHDLYEPCAIRSHLVRLKGAESCSFEFHCPRDRKHQSEKIKLYYIAMSHKDWELPNSRI